MNPNEIKNFLGEDWFKVQEKMKSILNSDIDLLNKTNESILSNSGKQVRPMLALLIARSCSAGLANEDTHSFAAAAELLHNATLLHDDVADDSDQRRGKPTIKSLMGPCVSVLVGDYWLVRAMELIFSAGDKGNEVIRYFSRTLSDLAEGEMLQLQKAQTCDTDINDYIRIVFSKTASLFEVAALSAAASVNAPKEIAEAVRKYAVALGIAFQIRDDIFDYSEGMDVGKPLGVDILEQKITMPLLAAMENVSEEKQAYIRGLVSKIVGKPELREEIVAFVRENNGVDGAQRKLEQYVQEAIDSISILPQTKEKDYLIELVTYVGTRQS
jgi:octaprenyl-diphosphate synthase